MIMADKIIRQRKKCGWSQEELAERLGVSRQAVSKWEAAQSTPDLARILQMGRLFGVSTDYLMKDELEETDPLQETDSEPPVRRVSMEEANEFIRVKEQSAIKIAAATFLCILSPACLIVLGAGADTGAIPVSENFAVGAGLVTLLLLVACAVAVFISCGMRTQQYEYMEKEAFETEYGVTGMVGERQKRYRDTYTKSNILGTSFCILSVIPLFITLAVTENEFLLAVMVAALLLLAGVGVVFFIIAGVRWESLQKLLQEGDYTREKKKRSPLTGMVKTVFWLLAVAVYLGYSFVTNDWQRSWIVWPIAGVLFAAVCVACSALERR